MKGPAKVSAITPVVDGVLETLRQMKSAEGKEFEVEMALREALANAIVHGCKNDESKHVQCSVACDETGDLTLAIRDPGEGFDPGAVADPRTSAHLHDTHGRGVYLINSLVDGVDHHAEERSRSDGDRGKNAGGGEREYER